MEIKKEAKNNREEIEQEGYEMSFVKTKQTVTLGKMDC